MATYEITAVKTIHLSATIEADSLEDAWQIEKDLIIDDFTETGVDYRLISIV